MNLSSINEQSFNAIIDESGGVKLEILPNIVCNIREGRGNIFDCWITNQNSDSTIVATFKAPTLEQIKAEAVARIKTFN